MTSEFATARARSQVFMSYGHDTPRKPCPTCGERFFTDTGLNEHVRLGQHNNRDLAIRWVSGRFSPAALASLQERGRAIAAQNNARRRSCCGCDLVTTPAALGVHQKGTGHTGWTEAT